MSIVFRCCWLCAAAGLGLGLGFALRAPRVAGPVPPLLRPTTLGSPAPIVSGAFSNHGVIRRPAPHLNDDSPLATQLERDLATSTGVTRWLYWLDALGKARPADFPRLLKLAQDQPAARRLVEARWIEVAPRHLFDTVVAGLKDPGGLPIFELAEVLFEEWPRHDPDAAIAAMNEAGPLRGAENWRFLVAYGLIEKDVERSLRLMGDWHADNVGFGPRGIAALTKWTREDPRHAAEFMLQLTDGYSFRSAMETIGPEWAKLDPAGALAFATSNSGEMATILANQVLKHWAGHNLSDAADWLSNADEQTRRRLGPTFVEAWAKQDPPGALSWCEENLAGSGRAQSVAAVLRGAAEKDVVAAAALVSGMSPSSTRADAAVAVAAKWFPQLASDRPVTPETVAWLSQLDPESIRRVMKQVYWGWATSDPRTMAEFLAGTSAEQVPSHSFLLAARELARRDPAEALDWAGHLAGATGLSAGGEAFGEWRDSQPESAMKWLEELPDDDPRRQAYFETAVRRLVYHPQAAEQLTAMSPSARVAAGKVIQSMDLPPERRTRLMEILQAR